MVETIYYKLLTQFFLVFWPFFLLMYAFVYMARFIDKTHLYHSVKSLVESEQDCILLDQPKLYTLVSIAVQYFAYRSTKKPGAYIIRIEDGELAHKILRNAKDPNTYKILQKLNVTRKLKYQNSTFYLDFFSPQSWNITSALPSEKIQGALVIHQTPSHNPFDEKESTEEEEIVENLPPFYHLMGLCEVCPKTIAIAYEKEIPGFSPVRFSFIPDENERMMKGVKVSKDIDLDFK